jgi:Ca-activated chloride channel homolog
MRVALTTLLYLLPSLPLLSNQKSEDRFAAESRLVLVNATVLDANNRVQTDLQAKDFSLFEDGHPVQVHSVSLEDVPTSTIILLDISGSMKKTIGYEREALERFLAKTRPGDEYCLVLFSNKVEPDCDFDSDPHFVRAKAARAVPEGDTSVIDALMFGLNRVKDAHNTRRAILVFSDAMDTSSRYKWREARNYALESTATIYAVSPPVWDDAGQANSLELKSIVEETGGRFLMANKRNLLADYMDRLEIRLQYVISFLPAAQQTDMSFHKVNLQLRGPNRKGQRAYWRHGYYATTSP